MASTVFSYSVKEADHESINRIERLVTYADTKGVSMSNIVLLSLKTFEKELDREWQPKKKK